MKIAIFITLLVLLSAPASAQLNAPAYIPTPNTTAISRYGVIPMSLYTGKANISVPVFSSTLRGITLNASLVYDTSGILINTLPSWTGTSWTLDVGGVITRAVKGYPDEYDQTNNHIGHIGRTISTGTMET